MAVGAEGGAGKFQTNLTPNDTLKGKNFRANKPFYVKVGNSNSTCMAKSNGPASAATVCPKWTRWEKI